MPDRLITAEEAQGWLEHLEAAQMTGHPEYRHWATIVHQAAQIKRLQKAVTESEVLFWEATGHDLEQNLTCRGIHLERDDLEDGHE